LLGGRLFVLKHCLNNLETSSNIDNSCFIKNPSFFLVILHQNKIQQKTHRSEFAGNFELCIVLSTSAKGLKNYWATERCSNHAISFRHPPADVTL
jgi:hypothetical protein